GPLDLGVAAGDIRSELAPDELDERHPVPSMRAQQFVCRCHRANASIERRYEISNRSASLPSVRNNSADGRECVLNAMVQLAHDELNPPFLIAAMRDVHHRRNDRGVTRTWNWIEPNFHRTHRGLGQ